MSGKQASIKNAPFDYRKSKNNRQAPIIQQYGKTRHSIRASRQELSIQNTVSDAIQKIGLKKRSQSSPNPLWANQYDIKTGRKSVPLQQTRRGFKPKGKHYAPEHEILLTKSSKHRINNSVISKSLTSFDHENSKSVKKKKMVKGKTLASTRFSPECDPQLLRFADAILAVTQSLTAVSDKLNTVSSALSESLSMSMSITRQRDVIDKFTKGKNSVGSPLFQGCQMLSQDARVNESTTTLSQFDVSPSRSIINVNNTHEDFYGNNFEPINNSDSDPSTDLRESTDLSELIRCSIRKNISDLFSSN